MNKTFLALILLSTAGSTFALPCPAPRKTPGNADSTYRACGDIALFKRNGQFGFFNPKTGEVLADAQFDEVGNHYATRKLTPVRKGNLWAYVNDKGEAKTPYQYERADHFNYADRAIVSQNGQSGIINSRFEPVVPLEYDRISSWRQPESSDLYLAAACKNQKCGFFNGEGKIAVPFEYDEVGDFGGDIAPVRKGNKWGYIDYQGKLVQPIEYNVAPAFNINWQGDRDFQCVSAKRNGRIVRIDPQGKILPKDAECGPVRIMY